MTTSEAFSELVFACQDNGSEAPIINVIAAMGIQPPDMPGGPDYTLVPDDIKALVGAVLVSTGSATVSGEAKETFLKCAGRVADGKPADSTAERMGDADIEGNLDLL